MSAIPIAIAGYYGYGNLGDEAIRIALRQELAERSIDAIWLTACPQASGEIDRRSILAVYTALRRSRALVLGGGGLLQNRTSNRSFLYYLGLIALARLARRPVFLIGQGIGPINGRFAQQLTRIFLKHATYIGCRDRESARLLLDMGLNPVIDADLFYLLPEVVASATRSSQSYHIVLSLKGRGRERILGHSKWPPKKEDPSGKTHTRAQGFFTTKDTKSTKDSENQVALDNRSGPILRVLRALRGKLPSSSLPYEPAPEAITSSKQEETSDAELVEKTVRMLDEVSRRTKVSVTLLPFFPTQDLTLSKRIADRLNIPCRIVRADTIDNTMHTLEDADLVISSRLHGLEFALRAGAPVIAISEDPKINAFVGEVRDASGFEIPCVRFPSSEQVMGVLASPPSAGIVHEAYLAMHARATEGFSRFVAALEKL